MKISPAFVLCGVAAVAAAQDPGPQLLQPLLPPEAVTPEAQTLPPVSAASESPRSTVRNLFAGTLAAVMQAAGMSVAVGLTQAVTGGLTHWFSRRTGAPAMAAPLPAVAAPPLVAPQPMLPETQPVSTQYFDPRTGGATATDPAVAAAAQNPAAAGDTMFAGLAFEVHLQDASGATFPVDPATHEFHTGDRFVVFYRTTLPGRMGVFNINPAGVQSRIDAVEIAAGQLAQLGPYEFTAIKGDEALRLVLTPCTTPTLVGVTRDIVNAGTGAGFSRTNAPAPAALAACTSAGMAVRGVGASAVRTRDIRKVAVEGTTGFALDAVSSAELASGSVTPREVTIVLRHR